MLHVTACKDLRSLARIDAVEPRSLVRERKTVDAVESVVVDFCDAPIAFLCEPILWRPRGRPRFGVETKSVASVLSSEAAAEEFRVWHPAPGERRLRYWHDLVVVHRRVRPRRHGRAVRFGGTRFAVVTRWWDGGQVRDDALVNSRTFVDVHLSVGVQLSVGKILDCTQEQATSSARPVLRVQIAFLGDDVVLDEHFDGSIVGH